MGNDLNGAKGEAVVEIWILFSESVWSDHLIKRWSRDLNLRKKGLIQQEATHQMGSSDRSALLLTQTTI